MSLLCQHFSSLRVGQSVSCSPSNKVITFPIEISFQSSFNTPFLKLRVQVIKYKPHLDRKLEWTTASVDISPAPCLRCSILTNKTVTYLQRLQCVCEFLYHWIIIRCYKYSFRFSFFYNLFGFLEDFTLWWQAHLVSEFLVGTRLDALRWGKEGSSLWVFNMFTGSFLKRKVVTYCRRSQKGTENHKTTFIFLKNEIRWPFFKFVILQILLDLVKWTLCIAFLFSIVLFHSSLEITLDLNRGYCLQSVRSLTYSGNTDYIFYNLELSGPLNTSPKRQLS